MIYYHIFSSAIPSEVGRVVIIFTHMQRYDVNVLFVFLPCVYATVYCIVWHINIYKY